MTINLNSLKNLKICGETLERWKTAYGHQDQLDETGDTLIKCEGIYQRWDVVRDKIYDPSKKKISSAWRYDHNGLSPQSYIKFTKLSPTNTHENPEGHYYCVIKTKHKGFMNANGHCYMELIDNEGHGYSFGLCGPVAYPFYGKTGAIVSPDPKEATKGLERRTKVIISKEKFDEILARVNHDKQNGHEYYHLFEHNCSRYVGRICEEHLGLEINNKEFITQAFMRTFMRFFNRSPGRLALKIAQVFAAVIRGLLAPLLLPIWILTGAPFETQKAKEARIRQFGEQPMTFWQKVTKNLDDALRCNYLKVATVWKLGVWQDKVNLEHQTNEITLEQARQIKLDTFISVPF